MNDADKAVPASAVERKHSISAIWLLPLFAVILGGWLAYKHFTEAGIKVVIVFPTGEGMQAGRTEVRYKGIKIGTVNELNVQPNLESVAAQVTLSRQVETALRENTQFWLVKPELSLAGVQGLDTLVSGNYIAMRPAETGATRYVFKALKEAPPPDPAPGDLQFSLLASDVGSLNAGSPVHYRKLRVGEIVDYTLSDDRNQVVFQAHIDAEYADLLHKNSRFWNTSGISITGGINSIDFNVDSLASIILGGVSFDNPANSDPGPKADNGSVFDIYDTYAEANTGTIINIEFPSADGIKANHTEIRYKGLTAGKILTLDMKPDYSGITASASIDPLADVLLNDTTHFWIAQPQISLSKISGLSTLLTGSHIEMDFATDTEAEAQYHFTALPEAPPPRKDKPGLYITLTADGLEGITRSSEVYYRNVAIGKVIDYRLNEKHNQVLLDVHVPPKFQALVTSGARFYQTSGIKMEAGLQGVKINSESFASILRGGIGLYLPEEKTPTAARTDDRFTLYSTLQEAQEQGPQIDIFFANSTDLAPGADVRYLGVSIGTIDSIRLNHPEPGVTATVTLEQYAQAFTRPDTRFWRVKPELSLKGVANLGTLVFGQYIAAEPGTAAGVQKTFTGKEHAPENYLSSNGLTLTLQAPSLASIKEGRTVFYREIPVGQVTGFELADDARHVNIYIHIEPGYTSLVRNNTHFWNATGINFDFGWLSGASLRTGSLQSLITGGIAFATPTDAGSPAARGEVFRLYDAPETEWLEWQPTMTLPATQISDKSEDGE